MEGIKREDSLDNSKCVLVSVLKDNQIVLNKSMLPKCVQAKDLAWEEIQNLAYMKNTGKLVTVEQLKKILQNMKTAVKKKTDTTIIGNRPIKLLSWEKEFLDLLNSEENPVLQKVPGAMNVGVGLQVRPTLSCIDAGDADNQHEAVGSAQKRGIGGQQGNKITKVKKLKLPSEAEETAKFSTSELQRWLLLEQIKLTQLQVKREELLLKKETQTGSDINDKKIITITN